MPRAYGFHSFIRGANTLKRVWSAFPTVSCRSCARLSFLHIRKRALCCGRWGSTLYALYALLRIETSIVCGRCLHSCKEHSVATQTTYCCPPSACQLSSLCSPRWAANSEGLLSTPGGPPERVCCLPLAWWFTGCAGLFVGIDSCTH